MRRVNDACWIGSFAGAARGARGIRLAAETPHQDSPFPPPPRPPELFREEEAPTLELHLISASNAQYSNYPADCRRLMRLYANNAGGTDAPKVLGAGPRQLFSLANYCLTGSDTPASSEGGDVLVVLGLRRTRCALRVSGLGRGDAGLMENLRDRGFWKSRHSGFYFGFDS